MQKLTFRSIATYVHGILVRFFHIFVYDIVNIRHWDLSIKQPR